MSTQAEKTRALVLVKVRTSAVLDSWRNSLFAFEWLTPDGKIRSSDELPVREREKQAAILAKLEKGEKPDLPILGIGIMDNVEIGSGKAVFLTLAARGDEVIEVLVPERSKNEFTVFLA